MTDKFGKPEPKAKGSLLEALGFAIVSMVILSLLVVIVSDMIGWVI